MTNTTVIFPNKASAHRVNRRLRDYSVLSFVNGREVVIELPSGWDGQRAHDLAGQLYREVSKNLTGAVSSYLERRRAIAAVARAAGHIGPAVPLDQNS